MKGERKTIQNGKFIEEKFVVEYKKQLYDITSFVAKHPGGFSTLENLNHKNIELKFKSIEHSKAAEYLLSEYKVMNRLQKDSVDESMEVSQYEVFLFYRLYKHM
jgi:cytochrome b involved in lipid metabolism